MIDEDRTLQLYGYTSDELSRGSHKPVVRVCNECGEYSVVQHRSHRGLCNGCAMIGRHFSPETRQKISKAGVGRTVSLRTRAKMGDAHRGEKAYNWKGGTSTWRQQMYTTRAYKNWRIAVFERDDYICQMCGERGCYLEAHHIHPVRDHKNDLMLFDVDNGASLCKKCHDATKGREEYYTEVLKR